MSRWLSLHGKSITLTGVFSSVQKRQLVRRLKASGASLHPSERTMPARVDVVVAAEFPDPAVVSEALERGARAYSEEEFIEANGWFYGVDRRLSELRGLLQGEQTPRHWWDICQLLEFWKEQVEIGVRYVEDHARNWPDELRVAPGRWLGRVAAGHAETRHVVCKAICHAPGYNAGIRFEQQLQAMPHVRHIKMAATSELGANFALLQDEALEIESIYLFYPQRAYPSWGYILPQSPVHKEWLAARLPWLRTLYIDAPLTDVVREGIYINPAFPRLKMVVEYPEVPIEANLGELFSGFRPPAE